MRKPCCDKQGTNKGAWSKQEDQKLIDYINSHGEGCWHSLPKAAGLFRCGKSCRLRWINYLRPDIKRGNFDQDEEDLIIKLHALLGNRWSLIAGRLPGRTDNEVKNYWNSHIRRKLARMGIDPNNHRMNQIRPGFINDNKTNVGEEEEVLSESKNNVIVKNIEPVNACNNLVVKGESSEVDGASSVSHQNSAGSTSGRDLNLDLTISSFANNVASHDGDDEYNKLRMITSGDLESAMCTAGGESYSIVPKTLLLFT